MFGLQSLVHSSMCDLDVMWETASKQYGAYKV